MVSAGLARTLLILGLCTACGPEPALPEASSPAHHAITSGVPDDGDGGAVALIRDGRVYCSGALIAPRVVLTAAHCLASRRPDSVFVGADPLQGGEFVAVIDTRVHPQFVLASLSNDIGLVLLERPIGVAPWPLWSQPFDDSFRGRTLRLVGYGLTSSSDVAPPRKRQGVSVISGFTAFDFTFHPTPSQTCSGDSGSPGLMTLDGTEYLVGVTSRGDPSCQDFGSDTRVDPHLADFVTPYLLATAERAAEVGDRCFYGENCRTGICVEPPDRPSFRYCSKPCTDQARSSTACPPTMRCTAGSGGDVCPYELPSPGALGAHCRQDRDCAAPGASCARPAQEQQSVCTALCFYDPRSCPDGFQCRRIPDHASAAGCFRTAVASGCAMRRAGPASQPELVLVSAVLVLLRLARLTNRRRDR